MGKKINLGTGTQRVSFLKAAAFVGDVAAIRRSKTGLFLPKICDICKKQSMVASNSYDIIADYIASMNPKKVMELKSPAEMQKRFELLVEQEKTASLTSEEKDELDHYIVLERLIRLAKANATLRLSQA